MGFQIAKFNNDMQYTLKQNFQLSEYFSNLKTFAVMEYLNLYRLMYPFKILFYIYFLYRVFYLNICMYTTFMSGAPRDQEKVLDPWNWSHGRLRATISGCWEPNASPRQQQSGSVFLTRSRLSRPTDTFLNIHA